MSLSKKRFDAGVNVLGALWGDYEARFMDFVGSLFLLIPELTYEEKDDLILQLQDVVDNFTAGKFMSTG